MTAICIVEIYCDTPGCKQRQGPGLNAAEVRQHAKTKGWCVAYALNAQTAAGDFCSDHYTPGRTPKTGPDEPDSQIPWEPRGTNQTYIGPVPHLEAQNAHI